MPEGDTVWRTARRLDRAFAGAPLTICDLRWGDAAMVDLVGRSTLGVRARGKHLLHRLEGNVTIHSHLRMEGQWFIVAAERLSMRERMRSDVRAVLACPSWAALGRRLGMLDVVPTTQESSLVGHLGPDVLGEDWDEGEALNRLRADPHRSVGEALLDQRNLAGIGTMYASETLFLRACLPWTSVEQLTDDHLQNVVTTARRLLMTGREHAVQSTTGSFRHGETTYVHGRSGRPCRRCGTPIRVASIGPAPRDRVMFSCPHCQGGFAPTDDGRPLRPLGAQRRRG